MTQATGLGNIFLSLAARVPQGYRTARLA